MTGPRFDTLGQEPRNAGESRRIMHNCFILSHHCTIRTYMCKNVLYDEHYDLTKLGLASKAVTFDRLALVNIYIT